MPNDIKAKLICLAICNNTSGPEEACDVLLLVVDEMRRLVAGFEQRTAQVLSEQGQTAQA